MYKGLYDIFSHWFHDGKGSVWFYSDTHFNDADMKYRNISDEEQVKNINKKVGKYDTIVILGDIGNIEFVKKLHGYKVLIMGNHDGGETNYKRKIEKKMIEFNTFEEADEALKNHHIDEIGTDFHKPFIYGVKKEDNYLFDEVYAGELQIAPKIKLSHEPIPNYPYALNIHGHCHGWDAKDDDLYHWNMCAEFINYTPVNLNEIIKSGRLNKIDDIHRTTIDKATERKQKREKKNQSSN